MSSFVQKKKKKFRSFFRSVEPWRVVELLSIQVVRHGGDRLPFDVLALVKILPCRLNGRVSQDPLNNVERRPFLHQPRCQCVPQSMRIDLLISHRFDMALSRISKLLGSMCVPALDGNNRLSGLGQLE